MAIDSREPEGPAVAARPARDHCLAPGRAEDPPGAGRYSRMFESLAPLRSGEAFVREQGRHAVAGGLSVFVDADEAGAAADASVPAGWPFFAQFLAHDLTADRSALSSRVQVGGLRNARAARLDLECVYGRGPAEQPYLVQREDPARLLVGRTPDLVGFGPIPDDRVAEWSLLFDLPERPPAPQRAKRIDGQLVPSLVHLPLEITGEVESEEYRSLAVRDLQRGVATGLPSGEAVAAGMGETALTAEEVGVRELGWTWETPLWFYVLKEAEVREGGDRLGPVGGRIVAEVLAAVVDADPTGYRKVDPGWTPSLPSTGSSFGLADLLAHSAEAGVSVIT